MAKQKFNFQLTNPAAQPVAVSGEQGTNAGTVASIVQRLDNNDKKLSIYILDNALNDKLTKNLMNELSSKKEVLSISLNKESKKSIYEDEEL